MSRMLVKVVLILGLAATGCLALHSRPSKLKDDPAPPPSFPDWLIALERVVDVSAGLTAGLSDSMGYSGDMCFTSVYGIARNIYYMTSQVSFAWPIIDTVLDITSIVADCPLVYQKGMSVMKGWYNVDQGMQQYLWNVGINLPGLYADAVWIYEDIASRDYFWLAWDTTDVFRNVLNLYKKPAPTYTQLFGISSQMVNGIVYGLDSSILESAGSTCGTDLYYFYYYLYNSFISEFINGGSGAWSYFLQSAVQFAYAVGDCREFTWRVYEVYYQVYYYWNNGVSHYFDNLDWDQVVIVRFFQNAITSYKAQDSYYQYFTMYYLFEAIGKIVVYDR